MTSLYNVNYLQHLCKKYGLIPSRKYGQNFLIHPEPIEKMLEAADLKSEDTIVEVGPGFGVLTLALAEKVKKIMSFEIEKKLELYWQEQMSRHKNIEIVWGNVLHTPPFIPPLKGEGRGVGFKVIANLPYQITSNVIRKFLSPYGGSHEGRENKPELMVLMVQKEVAERICAKPGDMSVLAISVQCYAEPEIVMNVPKSYFWPVPAVDSAVIRLIIKTPPFIPPLIGEGQGVGYEEFFKIVKAGFANRRKMLIKNLSSVADKKKLPTIFQELGISEKVRAQELSVEQWWQIVRSIELSSRARP